MYKLGPKACHIGPSINARTQRHGEERLPFMDIPLVISLTAKQTCAITGEPHTTDAWFATKNGKPEEPLFKNLAPYKFNAKFANSLAKITVGLNRQEIDCGDCTLNRLVFEPQSDGRTLLTVKVQCALTSERTPLFLWMDQDADVVLQFGELIGDDAQEELPLQASDEDDPGDDDDDDDGDAEIGTPEQERAKAQRREKDIAQQIADDRKH